MIGEQEIVLTWNVRIVRAWGYLRESGARSLGTPLLDFHIVDGLLKFALLRGLDSLVRVFGLPFR